MIYTAENTVMIGKPARVFVDGKEVHEVVSADTDKGEVVCYDESQYIRGVSIEMPTKALNGKVTVEFASEGEL